MNTSRYPQALGCSVARLVVRSQNGVANQVTD